MGWALAQRSAGPAQRSVDAVPSALGHLARSPPRWRRARYSPGWRTRAVTSSGACKRTMARAALAGMERGVASDTMTAVAKASGILHAAGWASRTGSQPPVPRPTPRKVAIVAALIAAVLVFRKKMLSDNG